MVAAAVIGGAVASAGIGAIGSSAAAGEQAGAAENAQQISENEFNTITAQESPFMQAGYGALGELNYLEGIGTPGSNGTASSSGAGGYGSLNAPFNAQTFQQFSPAYQFQLQQGGQGVLNQDASSQGALSGAALKDLIGYNQGMANTSFNNAFNQYQTQNTNIYNRLSNIASMGQNAAANTGQQGTTLAGQQAQSAQNIGNAYAGGIVGATNAATGAINQGSLYGLYQNATNPYASDPYAAANPLMNSGTSAGWDGGADQIPVSLPDGLT